MSCTRNLLVGFVKRWASPSPVTRHLSIGTLDLIPGLRRPTPRRRQFSTSFPSQRRYKADKFWGVSGRGSTAASSTLAMANNEAAVETLRDHQSQSGSHKVNNNSTLCDTAVVIRYQPGNERFQMQITLLNGKVFNFDRSCSDSLSNVLSRITTNISKKVKSFDGSVNFIGIDLSEINPDTVAIDAVLRTAVESSSSVQLQVGDNLYDVVFNPPEVYSVKFVGACLPTFPLFPYRMETSENFCKEKSLFKWEFSKEKPSPKVPPKLRKKSNDESIQNHGRASEWTVCGNDFIFTPEKDMQGGYLKFSCIPSNGTAYGKSFSIVLPNPVGILPVETFLYQSRLSQLTPKAESGDCLRVLTYNVLADTYATPEWFISSPKESLEAGYRLPILNNEIQSYQADIICLQEVDEKYYTGNFEPFLETLGYKGVHTSKTGNTKEGIATFYNPEKLTEIQTFECVILEHMKTLPLWTRLQTVGKEFTERLEERNTVFQVSVFQINDCRNKTILFVGNVHLYFHPDADHIRLLQTITCIDFLQKKIAEFKDAGTNQKTTVIYCGDLNCTPPFSSYRLLTTGQVDENDEDWTSHSSEKISPGIAFQHTLNLTNSHPAHELTNITTCFEGCLDYILFEADYFQLLGVYPPPSKEELAVLMNYDEVRKVSLPNHHTCSDHLPIIADFKVKS